MPLSTPHSPDPNPFRPVSDAAEVDDSELFIRRAFDENPRTGFELLFRRYYQPLHSHATRLLYSRELAEDIVSDVFLYFWQQGCYRNVTTSFRAYLLVSVRHAAHAHLRREFQVQVDVNQADSLAAATPSADQILQYDELYLRLDQAINSLPPQCQRVFMLSRYDGKTHREIADLLQIAPKTVEAHIHRALQLLKEIVAGQ